MRILKFIGAFLGTLLIVLLLSFGFNPDALTTLFNNSKDLKEGKKWVKNTQSLKALTEYIGKNPQHTAISSQSVTNPDTSITYQKKKLRSMGTLSNFFLITTYARLVENGQLDPNEGIALASIDRYQLPYIDASNHENAKSVLSEAGLINQENEIPLDQLVQKAISYNDLAMSDFLLYKLGKEEVTTTMRMLNLSDTDSPLPFSGLYITVNPNLYDTAFADRFATLQRWPETAFRDSVFRAAKRFNKNDQYHQRIKSVFRKQKGLGVGFTERRDALALFPKSTASELSGLMVRLQKDSLLSPAISKRVKQLMEWPYKNGGKNSNFKNYGAIYDSRLGLLNGMDYGTSVYSDEPFGQAVFFDSLQVAFWFHMSSNLMHQDYQQRLMWDPALRAATQKEVSPQKMDSPNNESL